MIPVQIVTRRDETPDIAVFELADPSGGALPNFAAGAHIDVEIEPGLIRQYSLCTLPNTRGTYKIGVLRDPGSRGGSVAMHACQAGGMIRISAPRNHFPLAAYAAKSLLLGGGIGITPLLAMAAQLHADGAAFDLHYNARSPAQAAFLPMLADAPYGGQVHTHFDDGPSAQFLDIAPLLAAQPADTHLYVCGPGGYMAWIIAAAEAAGMAPAQIHSEFFKAPESPAQAAGQDFKVRLASSGAVYEIPPDRSIAAVLIAAGIAVPVSCESGVCGTCLTMLRAGEPEHRDFYLTADEKAKNDCMLLCCSRAKSPLLVLEL